MRTLPGVQLTRASDYGQYRSSWLVTLPKEQKKTVGMVVRDIDVLLPPAMDPWQSLMRLGNGAYRHLSWHRTRREAEHAVLVEYRLRHDEAEAHEIADMIVKAREKAEGHAADFLAEGSLFRYLVDPYSYVTGPDEGLTRENAQLAREVAKELSGRRPDPHGFGLGMIERLTYRIRMNELEMERRERQAAGHDA